MTRILVLSFVLVAIGCTGKKDEAGTSPAKTTAPVTTPTDAGLVAVNDAPPRGAPFGLTIAIEAKGSKFAVRWDGLAEEPTPPISVDTAPTRAIETLRKELDDPRIHGMPISLTIDPSVPWSFVAGIVQVAAATQHGQANFALIGASKAWITINLGEGGTRVALPAKTPWSDAQQQIVEAARAGNPVELVLE